MKKKITTLAICVILCLTAFAQNKPGTKMNTIVLVHGAWLDASSWDNVAPMLRNAGHEVIVVNLPGHGKDNTTFDKVQLQTYVDAVKKAIGTRTDITLVGHSMGGIVVSEVAEQIPAQLRNLVYLAAFLPRNGESLFQLATLAENKESLLGKYQRPDEKSGSVGVAKEGLIETFAADVQKDQADKLLSSLKADALVPFVTPVALTDANFGKVRKSYVYTIYDKAIAYDLQQLMAKNAHIIKSYALPSSHVPFLSMPGVVAAVIAQESK